MNKAMQSILLGLVLVAVAAPVSLHAQFESKDAIGGFRVVRQDGDRVTVSVDCSVTAKRDFPVLVGGTLQRGGRPIGGFAYGVLRGGRRGEAEFTIVIDPEEDRSDQIEIYLVEPGTKPFVSRVFPLVRRWTTHLDYPDVASALVEGEKAQTYAGAIAGFRVLRKRGNRYTLRVRYEVAEASTLRMQVSARLLKEGRPVGAFEPGSIRHAGHGVVEVDVIVPGGEAAYDAIAFAVNIGEDKPFVRHVFDLPGGL